MAKKITAFVKLALAAGKATAAPPVGPALGQHGLNIAGFCKEYNARTADKAGLIIPVKITVYSTVIPIFLAVPLIINTAFSISLVFKSAFFNSAISLT